MFLLSFFFFLNKKNLPRQHAAAAPVCNIDWKSCRFFVVITSIFWRSIPKAKKSENSQKKNTYSNLREENFAITFAKEKSSRDRLFLVSNHVGHLHICMTDGQINKKNTGPHETHQIQTTPKRLNHTFDGSQKSKKSERRKTWRRKEELKEREREREKKCITD